IDVPARFHAENFRIKEPDKEKMNEVFAELEFKSLGKRILGEEFTALKTAPEAVQTDLFGNIVEAAPSKESRTATPVNSAISEDLAQVPVADKNITNTPHEYKYVQGEPAIRELITLLEQHREISFDTETTSIDANNAE
ncbi:hypothetical protein, partial [Mesorhizobium sp. M7A.F.Ca.US.011.01.1.1]|uniref:hypothetical protein n=1 Tax=Mesorhizobium sp. M7A.F.Ca.US.011.01.1.1 TaxID=2496741 RepID=UPI0019CF6DB6